MRLRNKSCVIAPNIFTCSTALLAFLVWPWPRFGCTADEPLRWKFTVGEKLDYNMVQDMNMSARPARPAVNTTMHQEMDMTWDVQGVDDEDGEAVIKQKFDRVKMKMTHARGGFEYDSKSEAAPTGLGAMIAPMYKAMTKGEFEITMTARGEVKDVKIPEEVLAALKIRPARPRWATSRPRGLQEDDLAGCARAARNPPKQGETWTTKVEMNNPAVGKQTVETTYTYDGTKEVDGTTYAVIKPQLKMDFESKPAEAAEGQPKPPVPQLSMKIAEQSSDGEVLFNIEKGRLYSTTLQQKVTIDATVNGQTMQQKIDQKIDVKVTPAGEKKAEEDSKKPEPSEEKEKKDK